MTLRYALRWLSAVLAAGALLLPAAPASASFFDVFCELSSPSPPYPTPDPVRAHVAEEEGGIYTPVQDIAMGLRAAGGGGGGGAIYRTHLEGFDSGGPLGTYGIDSFFDIFLEPTLDVPQTMPESFFDVFLEITPSGGTGPLELRDLNPQYPEGDWRRNFTLDWHGVDSFFDVFCEVSIPELPGAYMHYDLHFDASPIGGVFIAPPTFDWPHGMPDSFFDVFLEVSAPSSPPMLVQQLVTVRSQAHIVTDPVPTTGTTWGALKALYK